MYGTTWLGVAAERSSPPRPLLDVQGLAIEFPSKRGIVRAAQDVSFEVAAGERLAIVGESGSGKTVLALSLLQLLPFPGRATQGSALLAGEDLLALRGSALRSVRGSAVTMVFQDPMTSLNPVLRVSEQILPPLRRNLHLDQSKARDRAMDSLTRTGIPDSARVLNAYPHELSGGMRQRVLIAMALACRPRLLIADEPTTALDVTIQAQIVRLLKLISDEQNMAIIFITHDMGLVARFAHRVAVMYAGRIVEIGPTREVFAHPRHPYTQALLASIPPMNGDRSSRLLQIDGLPPDLANLAEGCSFAPRCSEKVAACLERRPVLVGCGVQHATACTLNTSLDGFVRQEAIARAS